MNAMNVTAAKPNKKGAAFCAPIGTELPEGRDVQLNAAFKGLGYMSEDGITNSNSPQSDSVKAWGGDVVLNYMTEKPDTFKFKLIEALNVDVLKAVYGAGNATGDWATGITIKANSEEAAPMSWVFDMIQNGGALRIVIPNASVTGIGEIKYKGNEPVGYELTISAVPDATGNTHYEYKKKDGVAG